MIEPKPPYDLHAGDVVARFLHHSHDIKADGRVHFARQMPDKSGERSVAHISGLSDTEVWRLGEKTLNPPERTNVTGRADLDVAALVGTGLRAVRDDVGFVRHTASVGWPPPEEKSARQQLAKVLAQACVTQRPPVG